MSKFTKQNLSNIQTAFEEKTGVDLKRKAFVCRPTIRRAVLIAGSALVARITSYASRNLRSFTSEMNAGISTFTGQAPTQALFLQLRQRCASSTAVSSS